MTVFSFLGYPEIKTLTAKFFARNASSLVILKVFSGFFWIFSKNAPNMVYHGAYTQFLDFVRFSAQTSRGRNLRVIFQSGWIPKSTMKEDYSRRSTILIYECYNVLRVNLKMHQIWCTLARRAKSIAWRGKVKIAELRASTFRHFSYQQPKEDRNKHRRDFCH